MEKQIIKKVTNNIRLGAHYDKYLQSFNYNSEEITTQNSEYIKSYLITNKENAPIFKGVLNILKGGKAVFIANYITYSGIKNKYMNFFNKDGLEIIHITNSTKEEKKYFDNN